MRKHFLLLFLMALLPLAGWAAEYSVYVNAKAISVMYGEATPATVSAEMFTANLVGTGAGVDADVKTAIAGKLSLSTARLIDSPVSGSYQFTLALTSPADATVSVLGHDYTILLQEATNSLVVTKGDGAVVDAAPTLVVDDLFYNTLDQDLLATLGSGKIAGTEITGLALEYSLNDGATWLTDAPTGKNVDNYTVTYRVKETDNYAASAKASLAAKSIEKGTPQIILPTLNTGLVYNGLDNDVVSTNGSATLGATVTYKLLKYNEGTTNWDNAGESTDATTFKAKNVGRYKIKAKVDGTANLNAVGYSVTEGEFDITKATLKPSIKAGQSKEFGDAEPAAFEAEYDGFKNGETTATAAGFTAPTMVRVAGENAGVYAISMNQNGAADNYEFDYSLATQVNFSITAKAFTDGAPFTFTVADATKPYTGSEVTNSLSTARFGVADLEEGTDYTIEYANNINVGTATMTIKGKGNFKGSVEKEFTIGAAPIYIKPADASKVYGTNDPEPLTTYTLVDGGGNLVEGAVLNGTVNFTRVAGQNVGTYTISVASYTANPEVADSYAPTALNTHTATFTINPSTTTLALKFKDTATKEKTYGEDNPAWSIDDLEVVSGLGEIDTWDAIKTSLGTPKFTIASEKVDDNATNQVTVSDLVSPAYPNVTVEPMAFTINKREITVTVAAQSITYGNNIEKTSTDDAYWTITTGTLASALGDTKATLGLTLKTDDPYTSYAVSATAYEGVIDAEIENTNYEMTVVKGDLTVSAGASITLSRTEGVEDLIKAYDGMDMTVSLDRNITRKEAWFAMVLPFEVSVAELSQKFGYAIVNVLDETNTDPSKVKFKINMQTIAANQPFLVKIASQITAPVDFGSKKIVYNAAPKSEDVAGNKFHGIFKTTALAASDYLWIMVPAQNKFNKLDQSGTSLTPINAYLETAHDLDSFAPSIFVEDLDGNVTAINGIGADVQQNTEGWYNLNGVKLQGVPTEKGVYIQNGKKVVIK